MPESSAGRQRAIFRLVNDVCLNRHDAKLWTGRLMEGVAGLFSAKMVSLLCTRAPATPADFHHVEVALYRGFTDDERRTWVAGHWRPGNALHCELLRRVLNKAAPFVTARRQDVLHDQAWYASQNVLTVHRPCGVDANMVSYFVIVHAQRRFGIGVHRQWGEPQFTVVERRELRRLHVELARVWRRPSALLDAPGPVIPPLSARLRQVHWLLCQGKREKEIARELGLSPHTVHNHIHRLYRALNVESRAELLALAHQQVGVTSLAMPPASMNEFKRI